MIRLLFTILIAAVFAEEAAAAMPRDSVTVEGDVVRLGDVFDVTGPQADAVIGRAPPPARREVYDAERLRAIARAYDVPWAPSGRNDRTVIERAGRMLEPQEIEQKILAAVGGNPAERKVELANRALRLYAATGSAEPLAVRSVSQDPRSGYFSATLAVATGDAATTTVQITGRILALTAVPVLTRRMMPGEIIKAADVATITLPKIQVGQEALLDPRALIGQTPRRPLREHQPVLVSEVRPPVLVAKGSAVTMVLEAPGLLLTAKGQALEDGAKGETIRILNTQSNRTVEAVVSAAGTARVASHGAVPR